MIIRKLLFAVLFAPLLLVSSCYTTSALQTAKPLDKGTKEFTLGAVGYARYNTILPGLNCMMRFGTGGHSDWGIGYATGIPGHLRVDYKYNFYRSADERNFLSTGLGMDVMHVDEDEIIPAVNVPLYFSMNHGKKLIPYFNQRFTLGLSELDVLTGQGMGDHYLFYSGGAGLRYSAFRVKYFVEFSYSVDRFRNRHESLNAQGETILFDNSSQHPGVELNVGLTFTFGE